MAGRGSRGDGAGAAKRPSKGAARRPSKGAARRPSKDAAKGATRRAGPPPGGARFASHGAGRTGAIAGAAPVKPKGLGGEQVEGRQAVRELLLAGQRRVYEVWVVADLEGSEVIDDIVALARDLRVPVTEVSRKRLEAEARSESPQGVLAKAAPLAEADLDALTRRRPGRAPFLVAVDGVTDPGNLGALLRSCDGAGVGGVVLPRHRAVHVTPTTAKTAAGAVEYVPIAVVSGLPSALARMREAGIWVVGLDDAADRSLFDLGDLATEGICLVMGAEGAGLSRLVRERCDLIVSIPMRGRLSSLNVSAAAALATFEVARHRTS